MVTGGTEREEIGHEERVVAGILDQGLRLV